MIFKKKINEDTQFEIDQLVLSIADLDKQNKKLKNIIDSKDKEIDELKERLSIYESDNDTVVMTKEKWEETKQEIERLNNIINELEKWCLSWKENDKYCYLASNDKDKCRYDIWEEVLDKLQELKGEDKE